MVFQDSIIVAGCRYSQPLWRRCNWAKGSRHRKVTGSYVLLKAHRADIVGPGLLLLWHQDSADRKKRLLSRSVMMDWSWIDKLNIPGHGAGEVWWEQRRQVTSRNSHVSLRSKSETQQIWDSGKVLQPGDSNPHRYMLTAVADDAPAPHWEKIPISLPRNQWAEECLVNSPMVESVVFSWVLEEWRPSMLLAWRAGIGEPGGLQSVAQSGSVAATAGGSAAAPLGWHC